MYLFIFGGRDPKASMRYEANLVDVLERWFWRNKQKKKQIEETNLM